MKTLLICSSQKPTDSDSAFASCDSNTRCLTGPLDGPETSSELELVKSHTVELRVRTSLMASMPFTLNGIVVVPTSWASLIISILDVKMGTTGKKCLCTFPTLKVTAPKKTYFDLQSWTSSVFLHGTERHSHWCICYDNGSINTRPQRLISRS